MTDPNFLLLGPPKCATSSLHGALCGHPDVAEGARKELFFLMDRGHPLAGTPNAHEGGPEAYAALFAGAGDASVRLDSTTHYLYQQTALDFARERPAIKACVVLRDPAERVYSSFNYTRNNLAGLASELSFAKFVELVDEGQPLYPRYCHNVSSAWVLERDIDYSRYRRHLEPWLDALGPDRLKIVLFDDLQTDIGGVTEEIWDWLGLAPRSIDPAAAAPRNVTRRVKYQAVHRLVRRANAALPIPGPIKRRLMSGYHALQGGAPAPLDDRPTVENLRERFGEDIAWLSQLLGRDLSHWLGEGRAR